MTTIRMPFVKTVYPESFGYKEPIACLVDVHRLGIDRDWMSKRAAAGVFKGDDIKPEKGFSYVHLIAMGDSDYYGLNRNGDGFMKQGGILEIPHPHDGKTNQLRINVGNIQTHPTFVKHAKVYRNHVNKDPNKACGDVVKSAHNDDMNRVELIIKVANDDWHDDLEILSNNEDLPFSMSCKVPYDICTRCGHKAAHRSKYCDCLHDHMSELTKEGVQIGAMNDWMDYFDISRVRTCADRIAYGLLKAASGSAPGGAEIAEHMTLFPPMEDSYYDILTGAHDEYAEKVAMLQKLSDIEKQIEAVADSDSPVNRMAFDREVSPPLDDTTIQKLIVSKNRLPDLFGALADVKVSLSLEDFLKIVLGSRSAEVGNDAIDEARSMLPGVFGRMHSCPMKALSGIENFEMGDGLLPLGVRQHIQDMIPSHSLADEPVRRRVTVMVLRGNQPMVLRKSAGLVGVANETLAERIATAYAMYKLALCQRLGNDRGLAELAVLQNYCQ